VPEQVAGCEGAFLIEPGDYRALAEKILLVYSLSKSEIIELGMKNMKSILHTYDNERIAREFASLFECVTNRK